MDTIISHHVRNYIREDNFLTIYNLIYSHF